MSIIIKILPTYKINLNDLNKNIFYNDPIKRFSKVCYKKYYKV